jgi:hypothetical protein
MPQLAATMRPIQNFSRLVHISLLDAVAKVEQAGPQGQQKERQTEATNKLNLSLTAHSLQIERDKADDARELGRWTTTSSSNQISGKCWQLSATEEDMEDMRQNNYSPVWTLYLLVSRLLLASRPDKFSL